MNRRAREILAARRKQERAEARAADEKRRREEPEPDRPRMSRHTTQALLMAAALGALG